MVKLYIIAGIVVIGLIVVIVKKIKDKTTEKKIKKLEEQLSQAQYDADKTKKDSDSSIVATKQKAETDIKLSEIKIQEQEQLAKADNTSDFYNSVIEGFNA